MSLPSEPAVVLVVEDEVLILLSTADGLTRAGCRVLEAVNADIALQLLETRPDITHLFTDIDLPGRMDGLQLAALVRERWPDVRIILTSGHVLSDKVDAPEETVFVPKPYDTADVLKRLAQ